MGNSSLLWQGEFPGAPAGPRLDSWCQGQSESSLGTNLSPSSAPGSCSKQRSWDELGKRGEGAASIHVCFTGGGHRGLRTPARQCAFSPQHVEMLLGFGWEVVKAGKSCAVEWQRVLQLVNLHGHGLGFAGTVSAPAWCPNQCWLRAEQLITPSLGCSPCLPLAQ